MKISLDWSWPALHDAFFSEAKYATIRSCRRSFKTWGLTYWLIERLLDDDTENGLWVDTTQSNIDKYVDRYFRPALGDAWTATNYNSQKKILTLPNKKQLDFGSAERPENLEGFEYDLVGMNEGGIILKKPGLWDNSIFPMTKRDNNQTRIVGTTKGKNKFHELVSRFEDHHFTVYDCPYYTPEQIEHIKKTIPADVFRQEYMAEFLDGAGSVFRNISQCIRKEEFKEPKAGGRYLIGVDLAKHQDFTVICVADMETKHVGYIDRFNQIDWGFQKQRIVNIHKKFNNARVVIDSTGVGDAIYDDLRNAGINVEGFKFTSSTKKELVQNLSVAIDNTTLTFLNDPTLVNELEIFGYDVSPSGNIRYNAPEGLHDDCVMALGLVNHGLKSTYTYKFISNY